MRLHKFAFILVLTAACDNQDKSGSGNPSLKDKNGSEDAGSGLGYGKAQVTEGSYDKASHSLVLKIQYSGCREVANSLKMEACATSYPLQCGAEVVHKASPGACEMLITQTFTAALDKSIDEAVVRFEGGPDIRVTQEAVSALAPVTLGDIVYNKSKHQLEIPYQVGGCKSPELELVFGDICAESYPLQCGAELRLKAPFDGSCKMLINETLIVPLDKSKDAISLTVKSEKNQKEVLIQK